MTKHIQGKKIAHRHERTSWLIAGGHIEWCFVCGAWRYLRQIGKNAYAPYRRGTEEYGWRKPSGDPKINPYKFITL